MSTACSINGALSVLIRLLPDSLMCRNSYRASVFPQCVREAMRYGTSSNPHVCIVGSGPAGFYTAQQILKGHPTAHVDIYDKLPVPFGLVRFGVSPDHPEVKNVITTFTQTAKNGRCSFHGNVTVGRDISVEELRRSYTAIVMCYGASDDRRLGIPGEDVPNVLPARSFVGWFNGLPEDVGLNVDLSGDTAVVLGQGNVALDVARILLTPSSLIAKTDITGHAQDQLLKSNIKSVYIVGRRGPLQVACTIKEVREMIKLPECKPVFVQADFDGIDSCFKDLPRPRKRLTELMFKTATQPSPTDVRLWSEAKREFHFKFLRSPVEIVARADGQGVDRVKFVVNKLQGTGDISSHQAVPTNEIEEIPCSLVLRSVGYIGRPIDDSLPYNDKNGIIPNENGRVKEMEGINRSCPYLTDEGKFVCATRLSSRDNIMAMSCLELYDYVYCSGWASRGPVGVILTTMTDGFEVGKLIVSDLKSDKFSSSFKTGRDAALGLLKSRGIQTVSFSDWGKIDKEEMRLGALVNKPREKLVNIPQMLAIAS